MLESLRVIGFAPDRLLIYIREPRSDVTDRGLGALFGAQAGRSSGGLVALRS